MTPPIPLTFAALINARLLSSRLPRKMVLPFAGSSLIALALDRLNDLDMVDGRYFAAAEEELLQLAARHPRITILKRSAEAVAPGYNGNEKVFRHCLEIKEDYIIWLNPCSPMLRPETIAKAVDFVRETGHKSYTSAIKTTDWIFDEEGEPVTNKTPSMISTAHSKIFYKVAHAFHILHKETFVKDFVPWSLKKNDPTLIEIPEGESYDVNTPMEFDIAEMAYLRSRQGVVRS